jgi:hypothetical protein
MLIGALHEEKNRMPSKKKKMLLSRDRKTRCRTKRKRVQQLKKQDVERFAIGARYGTKRKRCTHSQAS